MELTIQFGRPKDFEVLCIECEYVIYKKDFLVVCDTDGSENNIPFVVENESGRKEMNVIRVWVNGNDRHHLAFAANQMIDNGHWGPDE